jgi:hypothetical protein
LVIGKGPVKELRRSKPSKERFTPAQIERIVLLPNFTGK